MVLARAVLARSRRRVRFGVDAEDVPAAGYRQRRRARRRKRSPRQDADDDRHADRYAGDAGGVHQARVRRVGGAGALGATRAVRLSNAGSTGARSTVHEQIAREDPNDAAVAPHARLLRGRVEVRRRGARQVHRGAVARVPADAAILASQRVQQPASRRPRGVALKP